MSRRLKLLLFTPILVTISCVQLFAGGSGLNVAVVVNQTSTNSLQLANYFCEKRGVPPQNVIRISWSGGNVDWNLSEFTTNLLNPVQAALNARALTNQIDFLVLSMDIPYRILKTTGSVPNNFNSTTANLYYGFKDNLADPFNFCSLANGSTAAYAGAEDVFRNLNPGTFKTNHLAVMLTAETLNQARRMVDQGVASDGTFPTQTALLAHTTDYGRNVRYLEFDDAIFNTRLRSVFDLQRTNLNCANWCAVVQTNLLGYLTGQQNFTANTNTFIPGAMADNLTSFGGEIFVPANDQTTLMTFVQAGASGCFGTVIEPCNYLQKFPSAQNYFYQARGFSIGECYYQSVTNPYQGLIVAEPLAAPFARPATGSWSTPANALLSGTTNLSFTFLAPDAQRPIQQVDLFMDGLLAQTITNIPPRTNNVLYVTINGVTTNYTVPGNLTIKAVVSNLTARLNASAYASLTKTVASARGDRIELQFTNRAVVGASVPVAVSNHIGTASVLTTFLCASRTNFLATVASGWRNFTVTNMPTAGSSLQLVVTRTNGLLTTISVTNPPGNTNTAVLVQAMMDSVNTNADLVGSDGVVAEDMSPYYFYNSITMTVFNPGADFNLRARSPGWAESQIQALLTGTAPLVVTPVGSQALEENLNDLHPRNHLYLAAGVTNLPVMFPFNTTTNADGYHELTAVAYEGSHVRTQARATLPVRIQNTPLSATFTLLYGGTNTDLTATLQFQVAANTNDASMNRIELFSTGGQWGVVSNFATVNFSLAATNLQIGLHPFYALVTRNDGKQYRTETKWIRIVGDEPAFSLKVLNATPAFSWPATAGRRYEILSATTVTGGFTLRDAVTPSNSPALWSETNNNSNQRFYRVKAIQ
ncbi:MAG: TIGR03790 family protein [Verrucomicrobia bacterium]|nr:MAG: TIGR03790 family protein [Verrucomicrobiota bacterium]